MKKMQRIEKHKPDGIRPVLLNVSQNEKKYRNTKTNKKLKTKY